MRRHNRCGIGDPDVCGHPDCPNEQPRDEPAEQDLEALAEVICAAYYDKPSLAIADYADGPHFLNAARAVASRATHRTEAALTQHEPRWHGTGYGGGAMVCRCGDDCEDGYVAHLLAVLHGDTP